MTDTIQRLVLAIQGHNNAYQLSDRETVNVGLRQSCGITSAKINVKDRNIEYRSY